ncbi:MAG: hypothetical protein QOJ13_3051 [Gaiellales bacterium]|jgi:hypothetical protein|nr:hypothetical protein [Gaiellales bacterium]
MTYEDRMHGGVRPWLSRKRRLAGLALLIAGLVPLAAMTEQGKAASSKGCEGGGFSVLGLSGEQRTTVAAGNVPATFLVKGKYVEFTVVANTFGVTNYLFTGAANPLDITGGRRTVVFASKTPNHRGLTLTGSVNVDLKGTDVVIDRAGAGLNMKLQAKDCANGGLFQMEPQRGDGGTTQITHTLATDVFYFDNPNFRAREGDVVPYKDTTVTVTPRINFANDVSAKFVGRDSPQVATRVNQGCLNQIRKRDGTFVTVDHCGGVSVWNVASGGRMGAVFGEDATEVAPPATNCVQDCQAQNRVRGQAVVLGHPFPVPASSRLNPRFPGA